MEIILRTAADDAKQYNANGWFLILPTSKVHGKKYMILSNRPATRSMKKFNGELVCVVPPYRTASNTGSHRTTTILR
jgi:hypothetical protein